MTIAPPPSPEQKTDLPLSILHEINDLESWANQNLKDTKKETLRFWLFKSPAVLASASAGLFAYFQWNMAALIVGALGSICVLIDGLYPSGTLRNIHLRAYHDLRALQQRITTEWRIAVLEHESRSDSKNAAAQILKTAQIEKNRIGTYIRDAEASLGDQKT